MQYHVVAISEEITRQVRATMKSPKYGHPAHVEMAGGYGPCRSCLQTFVAGEDERILFTYDAFTGATGIPAPGPVFIHRTECKRFAETGFPPKLRQLPLLLESHARGGEYISQEIVTDADIETTIERVLSHPAVEYIQVRNAEAGCFMARIERVPPACS